MKQASLIRCALCCAVGVFGLTTDAMSQVDPTGLPSVDVLAQPDAARIESVARDTGFRFRAFGTFPTASATVDFTKFDNLTDVDNNIDFEDDLGLDLDSLSGGALAGFNWGENRQWHFDVAFNGVFDFSGEKTLTKDIIFGDTEFNVNANITSHAKIYDGQVELRYDLDQPNNSPLTFSLAGGLRVFYIDSGVTEEGTIKEADLDLLAPLPVLGGRVRWDLTPNLYVQGGASGMYYGQYGNFYEFQAECGIDFNRNVGGFVGYRWWALNVDYDDKFYDVTAGSLYVGVELRM